MLTRARRRLERGSFAPPEPDDCAANGCAGAAPAGSFLWQGPDNEVPVPICHGHHLETLEFGSHGSPLSCSIYNKSRELLKSGKTWLIPLWCARGYDQQTDVWRIEFRWKREALHNLKQEGVFHGIESLADLRAYLPYLWTYSAGHVQGGVDGLPDGWLRYTSPTDDNTPSRWPVHPAWSVVQSAFTTETEPAVNVDTGELVDLPLSLPLAELIRERQRQRNEKRLAQQIGGCCSTLAAWLTSRSATEPVTLVDVFLWLEENLPAYASPDLMKQAEEEGIPLEELRTLLDMRFDAAFSETVLDKQVLYGRRTLSER